MNLTPTLTPHQAPPTWREILTVRVVGIPKGQPRARAFARGGMVRMYDPGTAEGWKGAIALAVREFYRPADDLRRQLGQDLDRTPTELPVRVGIDFLFPRPDRLMRKKDPAGRIRHTAKPDRDNAEKAVLDCLTTLGVWRDDAQVCGGEVTKWYAAKDEQPGAEISISVLEGGAL